MPSSGKPRHLCSTFYHLDSRAIRGAEFLLMMPMIIMVPMPFTVVLILPMPVVVVFMVPVPFVQHPTFAIVVVMRMRPIRAFVRRPLPVPTHPSVPMPLRLPISLDPNEARTRRRPRLFINQRWRRSSNVHRNLRRSRHCHCRHHHRTTHPMQFHLDLL
jgi:hypothetical protein